MILAGKFLLRGKEIDVERQNMYKQIGRNLHQNSNSKQERCIYRLSHLCQEANHLQRQQQLQLHWQPTRF